MTLPFGSPPFAPPPPSKPSILDRLAARLFPTMGLFTDPQDQQAFHRQGLLQLGTNLLQAGGASPMQHGTLANIGAALGGVNTNELIRQALAARQMRQQEAAQQAVAATFAANPAPPNEQPGDAYKRFTQIIGRLAQIPGTEGIVKELGATLSALKPPTPDRSRWSFQTVMEGNPPVPVLYRINEDTGDKYRVGLGKPDQTGQLTPFQRSNLQTKAEFGAAALAAWRPLDKIRRNNPGVEEEVGKILASPAFAQAVPGFRSSGDAVAAIAKSGGSKAAQAYMRASWSFLDNVLRTRYATGRLGGPMLQQMAQEFLPSLDPEGNTQIHQNQIQAILSAQGESGFDLDPSIWNNATKRHGVSELDLQDILSGGAGNARLNQIRARY